MIKFSIIIPVKAINGYIRETVRYIQALDSREWELIILPNELELNEWSDSRINIISSGRVGPAAKRDIGANLAQGEILVFLDDDSYPHSNLLTIASTYFFNQEIVAIGGPAITPSDDGFWQKVSGAVFLSKLSGGNPERYVPIGGVKEVEDWPSVNFMVRRDAFLVIGGFNSPYWPGEDTKLCLDLVERTGKKILYIPSLIVWHHRRKGLMPHLKQVGAYGLHRGYFAKVYPRTSRKITYLMPSIFVMFLILSIWVGFYPLFIRKIFLIGWLLYSLALIRAFFDICKYENYIVATMSLPYIVATHFWYGICFVRGVFTVKLVSILR